MGSFSRRLLAVLLLLGALATGCSGDGGGDKGAPATGNGSTSTTADPAVAFAVVGSEVHAMAPEVPAFPADVSAAVTASLNGWLATAIVEPLRTGAPAAGLDPLFTEPALAKIAGPGPERAAMVEEGTPLSGKVTQERANVRLTAVTGPGGAVELVAAQIDLAHAVPSNDGVVDLVRSGELVLVPSGGTWRIDAFDVVAKRDTRAA